MLRMLKPITSRPKSICGHNNCTAFAMAPKFAPMLNTLAANNNNVQTMSNFLGKYSRIVPANPRPVTSPMRAHISCTTAIRGNVSAASHNSWKPYCAPVCEYVAMPDGSSSDAPVVRPGPRLCQYARPRCNTVIFFFLPTSDSTVSARGMKVNKIPACGGAGIYEGKRVI